MTRSFSTALAVTFAVVTFDASAGPGGDNPRVQVYDDRVALAVEQRHASLVRLPLMRPESGPGTHGNCASYVEAGMPPIGDGGETPRLRECQIHALVRQALPVAVNRERDGLCWDMDKLAADLAIGTFPSALNPRLEASSDRPVRAADALPARGLAAEVFPGCRGFTYRAPDWAWEFVLLAIADWNADGKADYLLELREYRMAGSDDVTQVLVALSAGDDSRQTAMPCRLAAGGPLPPGTPYAEYCRR